MISLVIITGILELSVWGLITLSLIVGVISIEKAVNKAAIGVSNKKLVHCHIVSFIIWLLFYSVEQAFFFWKIIVKYDMLKDPSYPNNEQLNKKYEDIAGWYYRTSILAAISGVYLDLFFLWVVCRLVRPCRIPSDL